MAAVHSPIELPTNRVSRYFEGPAPDVHDPNYIPVLNGAEIRVEFSQPDVSAFPSIPTPHTNASQTSLKRSKSGSAPETVVSSSAASRSPSRRAVAAAPKHKAPQEIGSSYDPTRDYSPSANNSDANTTTGSDAGSTGAAPALEEHVFMIPGNSAPKIEEIQLPTIPHSARSSISSTRKSHVPTSRYNKKTPSIPSLPPSVLQQQVKTPSPVASRGASPDASLNQQQQPTQAAQPSPRGLPAIPPSPEVSQVPPALQLAHRLQATKSTASERRARALHSHPSNISLKSRRNSVVDETDEMPLMQQVNTAADSRPSTSRSRSQSICNSQQQTPAPTTPLPDLPPGMQKRPPTREKPIEKPLPVHTPTTPSSLPSPSPSSSSMPKEHLEMSEYMTSKKSVVFRRFDEVHVRLLLHLQDEISSLERDLLALEGAGAEKAGNKASIMRELRKTLAEYDHLFANWCAMQANKASDETKEQIAQWLQTPAAAAMSKGAHEDLAWLKASNDLSCVSIDPEKKPTGTQTSTGSIKSTQSAPNAVNSFLAIFGCVSRRK